MNRTEQICHSEALAEESNTIKEKCKSFFSPFPFPLPAFTLAEVLITLGIIGVVASMTIPTLIQNQQEKATVTAVKKAYSELSQACTSAINDNGTPDTWDYSSPQNLLDLLSPYIENTPVLDMGPLYFYLNGSAWRYLNNGSAVARKLNDGSFLLKDQIWSDCSNQRGTSIQLQSICAELYVDVNGYKPPNMLGKDLFLFYLTKYGIVPSGMVQETFYKFLNANYGCYVSAYRSGFGCTAWVIYNENLGYLKCDDLSWAGKNKCD